MKNTLAVCQGLILVMVLAPASLCAQTFVPGMLNTTPDSRYQIHGNGTVTDLKTGLMWTQCSYPMIWNSANNTCLGSKGAMYWGGAAQAAMGLNWGGYDDWRVPNMKELQSTVATDRYDPQQNVTAFPDAVGAQPYWTSTPYASGSAYAYYCETTLLRCYEKLKNEPSYVRFVRGGY